jgi:hypothetical protein
VRELDEDKALKDLDQAHILARATIGKFGCIKWAVGAIFIQLVVFALLVGTVISVLIARRTWAESGILEPERRRPWT